jgi:type VI secretion system protein ImpH
MQLQPFSFRFFQAVLLLERMFPRRSAIGDFDPNTEPVQFGAHPSLAFPPSEIQEIDWTQEPPRMYVNFMGLQGPMGVLPSVYTELIEERAKKRDRSLTDFLDIFNHRFISLFYKAWKRYRIAADERNLHSMLLSFVGLRAKGLEKRHSVQDESFLFYSGLLSSQPRSGVALEQLLEDYFQVPVRVQQFVGCWYPVDADFTCRLEDRQTDSERLGYGVLIGDEVWDQQSRVRVRLGPLSRAAYDEFLPGSKGHIRLRDMTRFFARDQIDFDVQLVLIRDEVPGFRFEEESGIRLGWTTWMKTKPVFPRDPEDTILDLSVRAV